MDAPVDLAGYAHSLGRAQAAWRFAHPGLRRAAALASVAAAWDIFRRDAGAGDVGPAYETTAAAAQLLFTEDPRRDAVLLWLADHGAPAIAEAAATLVRMVGAIGRFDAVDCALLDAAGEALALPAVASGPIGKAVAATGRSDNDVLDPLRNLAAAIDRLRGDVGFLEGAGADVRLALPRGTLTRYVAAAPAGCWALNLALLGTSSYAPGLTPPAGLVSRASFRSEPEPEETAASLVEDAAAGWGAVYDRLSRLEPELARGRDALAHLSRNARTRDAWMVVAALGACTRAQLGRALGLSRAGADIQARALADAELVTLAGGGRIVWASGRRASAVPKPLEHEPFGAAVSNFEMSLVDIDRLLARSTR